MIGRFESASAFRQSLEQRLLDAFGGARVGQARKRLAIERLIIRFQEQRPSGFAAKGGFALDLRLQGRFRATRDLDLSAERDLGAEVDAISDEIEAGCAIDLEDGFEFQPGGEPRSLAEEGEAGTLRYLVEARVDGRVFERIPVDVRTGDFVPAQAEELPCSDLLGFAGIRPRRIRVIPLEYHFAEKVHAYGRARDRRNTRIRDLADMYVLVKLGTPAGSATREAVRQVFWHRKASEVPEELPAPPDDWLEGFALIARSMSGVPEEMAVAFEEVSAFYRSMWR
jgi:hypothetical protein